jgi:SAM-dependent methyltransferase
MSVTTGRTPTPYLFSNDSPTAGTLLAALSQLYDPFTTRRLADAGVPEGGRCLEIGAGNGSIAAWLADQAGPAGTVIATDVDPRHIAAHPGVTVVRHNIATDELPEGPFDVIHARAVLQHLPEREAILARLANRLTDGGVLVVEEMEADWSTAVLATPDPRGYQIFDAYARALSTILRHAGNDRTWCRRVHAAMREAGLHQVSTEGWEHSWPGGTGAAALVDAGSTEKHQQLLETGMSLEDLTTLRTLTADPALVLRGPRLLSTTGSRPA